MKKIIISIFILINNLYTYQMYLLNGPTAIGGLKMINEYNNINIDIINSPQNILSYIVKMEADVAVIPANMAAIIFNKQLKYKAAAVISETKFFIVSANKNIQTINDIKNQTIYCGAKLATPDIMLQYLISKEKIKNVNINYSFNNPDLSKAIVSGNADIAILPEPFLSSAMLENKDIHIVAEISKYIENYPAAILIAKEDFINHNKKLLNEILNEYKKSTEYIVNNRNNIDKLLQNTSILVNAEVINYGLNRMGLVFYNAEKMKFELKNYYNFIYNFNKNLIGGKIPDDSFYYIEN